jgi:hypothetical protein
MKMNRRRLLLGGATLGVAAAVTPVDKARAMLFLGAGGSAAQQQSYGIFNVKALPYAATGNTVMLADGAMSAGSPAFSSPSASFAPADVGKTICVGGAGISGRPLITTIASVSGSSATLSTSCSTSVSGAIVHYGTDDTAAIQSAINAVFSAGTGTVYFPAGIYMIAGALQNTSTHNAQLYLPHVPLLSPQVTIGFVGTTAPTMVVPAPTVVSNNPPPKSGSILFSPINGSGTAPALLAAWTDNTASDFSLVFPTVGNLTFRTAYLNPNPLIALQFSSASIAHFESVVLDVDATSAQIAATQPVSGGIGLYPPAFDNGAYVVVKDSYAVGYDTGFVWTEHGNFDYVNTYFCYTSYLVQAAYHSMRGSRIGSWSSKRGLYASGASIGGATESGIVIQEFASEHNDANSSWWFYSPTDVVDASNALYGTLAYWIVKSNVGYANSDFSKVGGTNLTCTAI